MRAPMRGDFDAAREAPPLLPLTPYAAAFHLFAADAALRLLPCCSLLTALFIYVCCRHDMLLLMIIAC